MNTLLEVSALALHMKDENPNLRMGQALMNALHEVDVQMYSAISQTDADCFYVDDKIEVFYKAISDASRAVI